MWGKCKLLVFLIYCITGSISFNFIPNMPLFVHFYHVFHRRSATKKWPYTVKQPYILLTTYTNTVVYCKITLDSIAQLHLLLAV